MSYRLKSDRSSVKATAALIDKIATMPKYERDRETSPHRLQEIHGYFKSGFFFGFDWVIGHDLQTDITYRFNGKHTSLVMSELLSKGELPEITGRLREYEYDTAKDAAALYASFDTPSAARNRRDLLFAYAGASPCLKDIPSRNIALITSGLAFNEWAMSCYNHSLQDNAELLLKHADFAVWFDQNIARNNTKNRHVFRLGVVAAMYRSWKKAQAAATEFWVKVRDDCNDPIGSPARELYRWLTSAVVEARATRLKGKTYTTDRREIFFRCMVHWNDWRKGKDKVTKPRYTFDTDIPLAS